MALPKFKITLSAGGRGSIEVDGEPVKGVRSVSIYGHVGELTTVTIEVVGDVEIEGEGLVDVTALDSPHKEYRKVPA